MQRTQYDCGPTAVINLARALRFRLNEESLRKHFTPTRLASLRDLRDAAAEQGLKLEGYHLDKDDYLPKPPWIAHMQSVLGHYVVVTHADSQVVVVLDSAKGLVSYERERFIFLWTGAALLPNRDAH